MKFLNYPYFISVCFIVIGLWGCSSNEEPAPPPEPDPDQTGLIQGEYNGTLTTTRESYQNQRILITKSTDSLVTITAFTGDVVVPQINFEVIRVQFEPGDPNVVPGGTEITIPMQIINGDTITGLNIAGVTATTHGFYNDVTKEISFSYNRRFFDDVLQRPNDSEEIFLGAKR